MDVRTKRVYDDADPDDGYRVLVDRLWPRGVAKDRAQVAAWARELAPSDELRRWFDHDPNRWDEFARRYAQELEQGSPALADLQQRLGAGERITLVFGARDREHNNAVALRQFLLAAAGPEQ
ncbi:MAG: DUF488 family protein [Planctomycetota bacterium]